MNKSWSFVAALGAVVLGGTLSRLQGQAQSQNVEQQLRSQYHLTQVGTDGRVVGEPGSILVIQQDGLSAIPASYGAYWYDNFKNGGRIRTSTIQRYRNPVAASERRALQVGEKAYLINMEFNQAEIVFYVQSCGACDVSAANPSDIPYRARLAIQFDKGYQSTGDLKQIQATIGQAFGIETAPSTKGPVPRGPTSPTIIPSATPLLKLPATYGNVQAPADQLQLNADHSFSLQEAGQAYHGTFAASGNTLELNISESNTKTTATLQGNNLTDSSGQTWVLREQSAGPPPGGAVLQNEDVIKMAKAGFDDAIIIAKISSSKCQFDTSTDALIGLKQNGVSAAVLKAMVGAGK